MKIGIYPALLNKTFTVLSKQKLGFVWKLFARLPLTQKMKLNTKNSVFMQTILQNPSSLAFIVSVGVKNRTEIPHEEQKITIGNFEKEQTINAQRYKHRKWVGVRAAKSSIDQSIHAFNTTWWKRGTETFGCWIGGLHTENEWCEKSQWVHEDLLDLETPSNMQQNILLVRKTVYWMTHLDLTIHLKN